ncbi:MAG: amidase family protein [Polyangiales bacterium]
MSASEYARYDAVELAKLVARGEVTASELLESAIARAEALEPSLGALTVPMYALARERAKTQLSGPLAGVPFLIKDLHQDYAGVVSTSGSAAYKRVGYRPAQHAEIVQRWLNAGVVVFGRTNTPEFGAKGITEPAAFRPARNPWSPDRSPGGSSGGSAAAVAAGIVPAAGASDGGGSIRIPAASCGLFGLKPGRGCTPLGPGVGEVMHGAAINHVLSRSVRDSACFLDATHGPELGSPYILQPPPRPYLEEVGRDPGRLRIAFSAQSPIGTPVDPTIVAAVSDTAKRLERLGHHVEEATPDLDGMALARDFLTVWFAYLAHQVAVTRAETSATLNDFEVDTLAMEAFGKATPAPTYVAAYKRWNDYGYRLAQFQQRFDLYLTPSLALPPPVIGSLRTPPWAAAAVRTLLPLGLGGLLSVAPGTTERIVLQNLSGVPFTQLANVTGVPAMSVPLHRFADGVPFGMQFVAAHGGEGLLLRLAAQLESELWTAAPAELPTTKQSPSVSAAAG